MTHRGRGRPKKAENGGHFTKSRCSAVCGVVSGPSTAGALWGWPGGNTGAAGAPALSSTLHLEMSCARFPSEQPRFSPQSGGLLPFDESTHVMLHVVRIPWSEPSSSSQGCDTGVCHTGGILVTQGCVGTTSTNGRSRSHGCFCQVGRRPLPGGLWAEHRGGSPCTCRRQELPEVKMGGPRGRVRSQPGCPRSALRRRPRALRARGLVARVGSYLGTSGRAGCGRGPTRGHLLQPAPCCPLNTYPVQTSLSGKREHSHGDRITSSRVPDEAGCVHGPVYTDCGTSPAR